MALRDRLKYDGEFRGILLILLLLVIVATLLEGWSYRMRQISRSKPDLVYGEVVGFGTIPSKIAPGESVTVKVLDGSVISLPVSDHWVLRCKKSESRALSPGPQLSPGNRNL